MEQPRAGSVQARKGGNQRHRALQQVLPRGGQSHRPGESFLQGGQQASERDASGAFRAGPRGQPRHGNQPGLPHAQRRDVHVRAAQARFECVLRQALGVGGRYPHGADRVPPVASQLKAVHPWVYPQPWDVVEVDARFRQGERVLQATKTMSFSPRIVPTRTSASSRENN